MARTQPLIAVVDDEEAVCRALKRLLNASSLGVVTFSSGQAFLEALPSTRPDCALLDLHMPGLSGLDLLKRLVNAGESVPVIIITGRDDQGGCAACLAAGASAYLPKPMDHAKLLQAIEKALLQGHSQKGQHPSRNGG
jgi:FixJ family two-component response regulator